MTDQLNLILTMKKYLQIFIISFFIVLPQLIYAQDKKPKVALVLSGGGAKGLAHIPLLQKLDSLGIVPDLVVGTSMGGVVGGLYAMGYSGDSIAAIAKVIDWDEVLGGDISLRDVSVEVKSEFKKYVVDLDLVKGKPKVSSALLKDQKLREFLTALTYQAYNVKSFDELSIPYRAVTTDIVNGKELVIKDGHLAMAMRATMSIPGVFKPIEYNNTLLVDGGVLNNFPVDIAKSMGADIIIGSDVGGGMQPKEKLNTIPSLLFQAAMLNSNMKNPANQKLCNILIDHVPNLTYSTGDFAEGNNIYDEGKIATIQKLDELVVLADQLKGYKQREHKLPDVPNEVIFDTIIYHGISETNLDLVRARANILPHTKYTVEDLIDGIDRAMGTNIFSQINYELYTEGDKIGLQLKGIEKSKHQIKASLHYDSYRGVGLIINYTGRNIIGKASRFLMTVDIAEQPRLRLQYQKNFGGQKKWWWRSEFLAENLDQNIFLSGVSVDDMKYRYREFDNQFNRNLNSLKSYVGIGLKFQSTGIKPKVDPEISENLLLLESYDFNNLEIYGLYSYNSLNTVFYPTHGMYFQADLARSIMHETDLKYSDNSIPNVKGNNNGFTKLGLDVEKRFSFNNKITGILGANAHFIFEDDLQTDDVSFSEYGYAAKYFLGGNYITPRKSSYIFPGLNEDELNVSQFMKLNLGIQFSPFKKVYITPHFNVASVGFADFSDYIEDAFSPGGNWEDGIETSALISTGATFSYHSFLGPVTFDVSWVNDINKVRLLFSVGLQFNRSN